MKREKYYSYIKSFLISKARLCLAKLQMQLAKNLRYPNRILGKF